MFDYAKKQTREGEINILGMWHKGALQVFNFANKSVLDIGCGVGCFIYRIKDSAKSILGIDPNPVNTEILKTHGIPGITGYLEDHPEIKNIDVAVCFEVIEHVFSHKSIFESVKKILPVGGVFIVSTPNAFNIFRAIKFVFLQEHKDTLIDPTMSEEPTHIRLWSVPMLKRAFTQNSFKVTPYGVVNFRGQPRILKNQLLIKYFSQHLLFVGVKENIHG